MVDLCRVTGYTRHQIRGLLDLSLLGHSAKGARFAREFRAQELVLVTAMAELETRFGVKRTHVGKIAKRMAQVLSGPRKQNRDAWLLISFDPPKVAYATQPAIAVDCIVMSLEPIYERADRHVNGTRPAQQTLALAPAVVGSIKRASTR